MWTRGAVVVALLLVGSAAHAHEEPVSVSSGANFTCALGSAGSVSCWGNWAHKTTYWEPIQLELPKTVALDVDAEHGCAISDVGDVYCWGQNREGSIGNGTAEESAPVPMKVPSLHDATSIAVGDKHSCAVTQGRVYCWGQNTAGALGDGTRTARVRPVQVKNLMNAVEVAAGGGSTCARTRNGAVYCWGANRHGQVGGSKDFYSTPRRVSVWNATSISVGGVHNCARTKSGNVMCWGYDTTTDKVFRKPKAVPLLRNAIGLSLSHLATGCGWFVTGKAKCVGYNEGARLGIADTNLPETWPVDLRLSSVSDLSVGRNHGCAVSARDVYCWGTSKHGALGVGQPESRKAAQFRATPTKVIPVWNAAEAAARRRRVQTKDNLLPVAH